MRGRPLSRNVSIQKHCSVNLFSRDWQRHLLVCLCTFDDLHLFLVVVFACLFVSDVVADLHLLFNQVLGLDKRPNELFSLFFLQMAHFVLMNYICNLELLFLCLQFVLLVNQFLSQDALFVVEVEEDTQVFGQLVVLLSLDDSLDFPLLGYFLSGCVCFDTIILVLILEEAFLLLPIYLRLQMLLLPKLLF